MLLLTGFSISSNSYSTCIDKQQYESSQILKELAGNSKTSLTITVDPNSLTSPAMSLKDLNIETLIIRCSEPGKCSNYKIILDHSNVDSIEAYIPIEVKRISSPPTVIYELFENQLY